MKIFISLLLLYHLEFNTNSADPTETDVETSTIPTEINLELTCEYENDRMEVSLEPVDTFLANKNLPVWIAEEESPTELKPINVMKELGPFTTYHDSDSCSAAVYFHNTAQIEGTLGHLYAMHKLKYNAAKDGIEPTDDTLFELPIPKHDDRFVEDKPAPIKKAGHIKSNFVKSLREYPDTVYIETLVTINDDITADLGSDYSAVVTYVLTLFNSVDMLYSVIEKPKIKVNIAGIIIGNKANSFPRFKRCYEKLEDRPLEIIVDCVNRAIGVILDGYQLPFQSYDIVVFLTRGNLGHYLKFSDGTLNRYPPRSLRGISYWADNIGYRKEYKDLGVAIASDPENFQNYPTVAHEMAHLFGVPHNTGPLWSKNGKCLGNLMKRHDSLCKKCLPFGGRTPEYFENFFGTRDACIFHNKPRSLEDPPGPRLFWTPHEQCQCYGYKSNHNPKNFFRIFSRSSLDCETILKCVDDDGTVHDTNVYMDGTPCKKTRNRKVCWNKQCMRVQKSVRQMCEVRKKS